MAIARAAASRARDRSSAPSSSSAYMSGCGSSSWCADERGVSRHGKGSGVIAETCERRAGTLAPPKPAPTPRLPPPRTAAAVARDAGGCCGLPTASSLAVTDGALAVTDGATNCGSDLQGGRPGWLAMVVGTQGGMCASFDNIERLPMFPAAPVSRSCCVRRMAAASSAVVTRPRFPSTRSSRFEESMAQFRDLRGAVSVTCIPRGAADARNGASTSSKIASSAGISPPK